MVMPICFNGGAEDMFEPQLWNKTTIVKGCQDKWKVTPRLNMADIMYGAKKLEAASNIVFR